MSEWAAQEIPSVPAPGTVTLVEGTAFCVCAATGDISRGGTDGLFYSDTRLVSRWELRVDDRLLEPVAVIPADPFSATFLGRGLPRPGKAESSLLVTRARYVGAGMREDIAVHNMSNEPAGLRLSLYIDSDLADLFDVKAGLIKERGERSVEVGDGSLAISASLTDRQRGVRVSARDAMATPGTLSFHVAVPARGTWQTTVLAQPIIDGHELPPRFPPHRPIEHADPARRLHIWEKERPVVYTQHTGLAKALERSQSDLGSLRIFDEGHSDRPPSVAAGAPWFMTIFGRDSLISSWMALPIDRSLALGTVLTLADLQGECVDPLNEEEPGKIMHELRHGVDAGILHSRPRGAAYYGSVDATPLFVMVLGELRRWGLHDAEVSRLRPHADRAMQWIDEYGDLDGDGFVEYQRKTDRGLINQGWKDSYDGVNFADGTLPQSPIALCEVQGYVYAAFLAMSHFAREQDDIALAKRYLARASELKHAFNETFWLPDRGWYAEGLDRDKRPIDALASNMGHCLLCGIVDVDKAGAVADWLMSPEMFTGWGIRTLASTMGAYNPMSYHNGSVWPHDNAMIAGGLMRYGFVEQAQRVAMSLLDAACAFDGRLPELFCGFDRSEFPRPVPYPTSCCPQAWAAASPVHLLRTLLRFDPWIPYKKAWIAPALPPGFGELRIERFTLAGSQVSIEVSGGRLEISGWPKRIELIREARPPLGRVTPSGDAP
ncbi:MAG: sle [Streptosporangiaceae bacterium]|jgi:glycogen debranching enzyme|nr:sle [Streptosporangiaceae bacterium]